MRTRSGICAAHAGSRASGSPVRDFEPVRARYRADGWAAKCHLTYMGMIIDSANAPDAVLALWRGGPSHDQPAHATETCRLLDRVRRGVWENADGLIRPPVGLPALAAGVVSAAGGVSMPERAAAHAEACRRMAAAQALWEPAATEEG